MNEINITLDTVSEKILTVLGGKAFFSNRFLSQVKALYPNLSSQDSRLAPLMYVKDLIGRLPVESRRKTAELVTRKIVNEFVECPPPATFRQIVALSVLESMGMTTNDLYERAKNFMSIPPASQDVANRWVERVIYTAIRLLTRERFIVVSQSDWSSHVVDVIFMDKLQAYSVSVAPTTNVFRHNYKELLKKNG